MYYINTHNRIVITHWTHNKIKLNPMQSSWNLCNIGSRTMHISLGSSSSQPALERWQREGQLGDRLDWAQWNSSEVDAVVQVSGAESWPVAGRGWVEEAGGQTYERCRRPDPWEAVTFKCRTRERRTRLVNDKANLGDELWIYWV